MQVIKNFSIRQGIVFAMMIIISFAIMLSSILYYFTFTESMNNVVESSSKEINKQIILNFEKYIDDVIEVSKHIQINTTDYDIIEEDTKLEEYYSTLARTNKNVVSIILLDLNGNIIVNSEENKIFNVDLKDKSWFYNATIDPSIYHFSSPHQQDVFKNSKEDVISVSKVINYKVGTQKKDGVLLIDISTEQIKDLANHTNLGENGHILILNDDDSLIYSSNYLCFENECISNKIATEIIIGGSYVDIDGTKMYANVNVLNLTRWRIATFSNVEIINNTRTTIILMLLIIFVITISGVLYFSTIITNRITSPLNKLKNHMQGIQNKKNLYTPVEVDGQKEVVVLSNAFNKMIKEITDLMNRLLKEQKEKRKSEFIALQTQINPHFLYNTLDSIIWLSENNLNEQVIDMVVSLSKFFRISISRGKNVILASEELEHAKSYLLIQKIRYANKFDYKFEVSDDILDVKVVKLILQPLIENAIYHGVGDEEDASIIIRAYKDGNQMIFEVENSGYGISEEKINEIYQTIKHSDKKSVGLKNVYSRLKIYYGEEADLNISSVLDEKTIVKLSFPIKE